jgi:hypothetical protein
MNANYHPFYKHSGKFGIHGPLLALSAGACSALPLGLAYSYLIKWIPFIYLNFLITAGYGFAFGLLTTVLLKFGKVRNNAVALLCSVGVGLLASYGSWAGCVHALVNGAPWFLTPGQILRVMNVLLQEGSWGIGLSSHEPVTGIFLAIVWIGEAGIIVGICTIAGFSSVSHTPFCETHDCWLDEEKKIDKLDVFVRPEDITAFKSGDIAPLEQARPRVPASGQFARLTLKYSSRCEDYCAFSIANVTVTPDKDGKMKEKVTELMTNLWVPKTMFDYLARFEHVTARSTVAGV